MIAVMVRFQYEHEFNEARLQHIAEGARTKFQGMPGLRSKAFTVDAANRQALNFYVWESEDAARKFFSPPMIDGVATIYGVRPSIEYLKLAVLVENPRSEGRTG
ncbi:MAG: YdhR family protein [Nitrospira sp.]